jgi:putative transposase
MCFLLADLIAQQYTASVPRTTIIRTEAHALATTPEIRADVERTVAAYRRGVRALCSVLMVHMPEISKAKSKCQAIEALFHATAQRPTVRYPVLDRILGKMPSYLRRAAIEHAFGVVSSFQSNWSNWLDGEIGGEKREIGTRSRAWVFPTCSRRSTAAT